MISSNQTTEYGNLDNINSGHFSIILTEFFVPKEGWAKDLLPHPSV
jgi:hypothetical protein